MFLFKRHTIFLNSLWEYQSHLQCFLLSPELRLSSRASPSYFLGSGTHGQACQPADFTWGRDGCEPGITTGNSRVPVWRGLPCEVPTCTYFSSGSNSPPGASLNSFGRVFWGEKSNTRCWPCSVRCLLELRARWWAGSWLHGSGFGERGLNCRHSCLDGWSMGVS